MAQPLLRVDQVSASYGKVEVVHKASLDLYPGELLLVAGPNGAGKSTLLRVLIGLHQADHGRILLEGNDVTRRRSYRRARSGLAWIPEGRGVIRELSVRENLDLATFVPGWSQERRERSFSRFPVLKGALDRAAGTLSGGEQQMLALARALESSPQVLVIDEPSLGLAPKVVDQVMKTLVDLRDEGQSILLIEQRAAQVQHVADRILLMRQGHIEETDSTALEQMSLLDFAEHAGSREGDRNA